MSDWASDSEFLETFTAEARERLQILSEGLLILEQSKSDEELIKRLFREAHTLKGSAGMMGLPAIKEIAHRVEDVFSALQKGQLQVEGPLIDTLLGSVDRISEILPDGVSEPSSEDDVSDMLDSLACVLKGEKPTVTREIKAAPVAQPAPAPEPGVVEPGPVTTDPEMISVSKKQKPVEPPIPDAKKPRTDSTIRVNIERLDKLLNLMGEILVNQIDTEDQVRDLGGLRKRSREMQTLFGALVTQAELLKQNPGDGQIAAISEKLINAEHAAETLAEDLEVTAAHLQENTATRRLALDELQDRTLHVRMLPLSTIFDIYPRVVRDASGASGKSVKLHISGESTELDKRILEQVTDPLMHIIRNCVDHGIEPGADRASAGKPERGNIHLSARQRGDRVEIIVEDDGGGIDPEKVRQTALSKGLISDDTELTFEDSLDLIFRPGFSTAKTVTAISGRGVGLDVVKNNIEKLEGSVAIESTLGAGTRFTVSLPVTLAVISGLLVESNGDRFILPLGYIQEMVAISDCQIQSLGNHRGFLVRGSAIPLIDLHEFLGGSPLNREDAVRSCVVIVGDSRYSLGLHVGHLVSEQEVVIKSPGELLSRLPFVAGVTVLGSGEAVVVANVIEILKQAKRGDISIHATVPSAQLIQEERKRLVLVVDDSLVVRELQKNILEAAGYEVDTAVDGEDALEHLAQHRPFDCVVTDIEMPRMNGYDLTTAIRHKDEIKEIPVVMVTSRSSDDDKKKGMDAGANAYVVKGSFDQQGLLSTIQRLVA
ncbi:MAG: hybrid sensor histidine kinase/response regulator [Thermoleophilia bacterium]